MAEWKLSAALPSTAGDDSSELRLRLSWFDEVQFGLNREHHLKKLKEAVYI